ncbi:hypothetical protein [Microbacterium sp. YJN-G]|uniref:hypothetical protein n=1 Tax=Microbacterium sp. YJN-G TaxID=2763257 RepID=UPI0018777307|nr:hypothetical protein [Microbacterium sp. YJN-G]
MPTAPARKHRDDSEARRSVRLATAFALVAAALGVLLVAMPKLLPAGGPWVQLGLGALALFFGFRARALGVRGVNDYDGRLSLLAVMAGFATLFFAGGEAFRLLAALGG